MPLAHETAKLWWPSCPRRPSHSHLRCPVPPPSLTVLLLPLYTPYPPGPPALCPTPPNRYALGLFTRRPPGASSGSSSGGGSSGVGRLELMPAEGGKILRLEPRVHGQSYEARGVTTVIEAGKQKEANMRLVEEFGSQRRKRQLKAREAGKVEAGHVSAGQAVLGMIAQAGEAAGMTKEEVIKASLAQRNIPPHHPEARTAEEAYRSDELVPLSIRDGLEITKLFPAENKAEYRETLKSSGMFGEGYVLSRLPLLCTSDVAVREERARMLCMLGHLLKLYSKYGLIRTKAEGGLAEAADRLKIGASVLEGMLDLFYTEEPSYDGSSKYLVSMEKKSLLLGYILVLAVRVEHSCLLEAEHFQALADELRLKPNELVQRYRELGCKDIPVSSTSPDTGVRSRGARIALMPASAEDKTLADYFPGLKLGKRR